MTDFNAGPATGSVLQVTRLGSATAICLIPVKIELPLLSGERIDRGRGVE